MSTYPGSYPLPFGKHKGKPLDEVPLNYLDWLAGRDLEEWKPLHEALHAYLGDPAIQRLLKEEIGHDDD